LGCGVVHADGSPITFGESCALMGMLGCTILIPGPPGLLGVFQAGIYAGMTMYFPTSIVTGPGSAYVCLLYALQLVWQMGSAAFFLAVDRDALRQLSHAPVLSSDPADQSPDSVQGEELDAEALDLPRAANG
jgi:glycosyltransferase 2 family protein